MSLQIRVLTPATTIYQGDKIAEIYIPSVDGIIGVLNDHAALISSLGTGLLKIKLENGWLPIILSGGIVEINKNNVTIITNDAEEITKKNSNKSVIKKAFEEVKIELEKAKTPDDRIRTYKEYEKAKARLEGIKYLS